ncbi:DEAD-box ATP-dependent RNA helicase 57 [Phytophthora fragariae]|nr:DEAD-box ATP-dependent RNA helicase 57 [Phytophthora fragariae]KAE8945395.1 DEAD-box ATP-dependent RNA helicase 57 [Phytophthora fragariae]KAE9132339.1 DEAD-box ATP-dependent RNA helicase 57 [Phytophthora fragariae]KAE9151922.1 DEAD-box ATP-dependent RNA helicase 57 [Phytophthora fragariae]KAE9227655.1 DEAD-box ATP-dependent RNA helicase 57 [Phytophthora fragariae]
MSSSFFGALTQGAKFGGAKFQKDRQQFKKLANSNRAKQQSKKTAEVDELDFFGFDAVQKPKEKMPKPRKISVDMVPEWAGNEPASKPRNAKGSKPRRKRKLSEGALGEQRLEDEARQQASQLLAPPKTKADKRREKRARRRSRTESMGSEAASQQSEVDAAESDDSEEEDEDEEEAMTLFKSNGDDADEELADGNASKKVKKETKKEAKKAEKKNVISAEQEGVQMLRRQLGIRVSGVSVPAPITAFADMRMDSSASAQQMKRLLLKNIERSEYKEPTSVQMQAIPSFLLRRDVLATAPTGSGKTAAFAIPILANLAAGSGTGSGIRSIVLAPTRDLAVQIRSEFTRLAAGKKLHITLLSKATAATIASQTKSKLAVNHDVLIATPLRLVHLIQEVKVDLSTVEMVCLDEADRLLELGFVEQVDEIFAACTHAKIQRAMFSATMLEGVEELAQTVLRDPVKVAVGTKNAGASTIDQKLVFVGKEEGKLVAMKQLLHDGLQLPALLFVQNKERANELYHELLYDGVNIGAVHADRTKEQRDDVIRRFRTGEVWVLICTDLMSRGMDFKAVNMVINYDFPQSAVSYIHRIGRTGRNGRKGKAVTFFTEDDMVYLRTIANVMKISGCEVPDWMLSLKKASMSKRKELLKAPPMRHRINTVSGYDLQKANRLKQMKHAKHNKSGEANNQSESQTDEKKQENSTKSAGENKKNRKKHKKNPKSD